MGFVRRFSDVLLWTVVIGLVVVLWPNIIAPLITKRVTLLTGPDGGFDRHLGKVLRQSYRLASPWKFWGRRFQLEDEETQGSEENRQIIDRDLTGTHLGFALDGFEPTPNIRSMLRLFDVPLHIVVRKDFYEQHAGGGADRTLGNIVTGLNAAGKSRVYLGLEKSGSRQVARIVLKHYGVDSDAIDCGRQYDLNQVEYALIDGTIDMAFVICRLGWPAIQLLADSKQCYLLGLDGEVGGILGAHSFLAEAPIRKHVYGDNDFQPSDITTVSAHEVLICSAEMSNTDAYWLASSIQEFLVTHFPEDAWAKNLASDGEKIDFKYPQHSGAESFAKGTEPWFVHSANYVFLMVLLPAIVAILQRAPTLLAHWCTGRKHDATPKPAEAGDSICLPTHTEKAPKHYEDLDSELEAIVSELENQPLPSTEQVAADFARRVQSLRQAIGESFEQGAIDRRERAILRVGLRYVRLEQAELQLRPLQSPTAVAQAIGAKKAKKQP